jgi:hypothetical protein
MVMYVGTGRAVDGEDKIVTGGQRLAGDPTSCLFSYVCMIVLIIIVYVVIVVSSNVGAFVIVIGSPSGPGDRVMFDRIEVEITIG